jgi:ATP-dependent DNA helicase RecG
VTGAKSSLQALVAPLTYAARDGFARVHTLKGFEGLIRDLGQRATREGLPAARAVSLAAHVAGFETMPSAARVTALRAVIAELQPLVVLPPELAALAVPAPRPKARPAPPAPAPAPAPRSKPKPTRVAKPRARTLPLAATEADADAPYARAPPKVSALTVRSGPLATPLEPTFRVHPRLQALLQKKGLRTAGDLLFLMPRTYEDRRQLGTVAQLVPGERGSALVEVKRVEESFIGRGRRTLKVVFGDHTGSVGGTFFNYAPWMKSKFAVGKKMIVSGELRATPYGRDIAHPETEPADDLPAPGVAPAPDSPAAIHFERIVPLYPGFERGEQRGIRDLAHRVVARVAVQVADPLPEPLRRRMALPVLGDALRALHFPDRDAPLEPLLSWSSPSHRRLAFDELFFLQLGLAIRRQGVKAEPGIAFRVDASILDDARAKLPFTLTGAQARALDDIARDMARPEPMNRLLQGDVGSGKTAVALVSALIAIANGHQVALMAPTEILAEQHARTLQRMVLTSGIEVGLLTGSLSAKEKREARARLAMGRTALAVGTHALLEETVQFHKLGLVIIDEQHRFGVMQRASLRKGLRPDVLVMTATPIPRTLAMAAYGDLDLSVIDALPPGRTPIVTRVFDEKRRGQAQVLMQRELAAGRQAYVIYPLVEESEKVDLQSATEGAEEVRAAFPDRRVGLLHGRMKGEEKAAVMRAFRDHALDVLVATTVVEVGVDVPNATVMLIESAERFGLSQLHQLRGRVGRGAHASHCLLIAGHAKSDVARERLATMEASADGFVIAQKDLELRGPGEFLGTRQSGLPELAVANLARDQELLALARREAMAIAEADPRLALPVHAPLAQALVERWEGKLALAKIG